MKKILTFVAIVVVGVAMVSCGNQTSKSATKSVVDKLNSATTVDEVERLLDGTTWHYTENLSHSEIQGWCKVSFNNGLYTTYYAKPSDGKWTKGGEGKYEVYEGRYSNTGEKYIAVSWEGKMQVDWLVLPCEFTLTMDNFQLVIGSSFSDSLRRLNNMWDTSSPKMRGYMTYGDYDWK